MCKTESARVPWCTRAGFSADRDIGRSIPRIGPGRARAIVIWLRRQEGQLKRSATRLTLAPLERLAVPHALSGADGENRSTAFCYIQANHDLGCGQRCCAARR
jgi:hypothetical protein